MKEKLTSKWTKFKDDFNKEMKEQNKDLSGERGQVVKKQRSRKMGIAGLIFGLILLTGNIVSFLITGRILIKFTGISIAICVLSIISIVRQKLPSKKD